MRRSLPFLSTEKGLKSVLEIFWEKFKFGIFKSSRISTLSMDTKNESGVLFGEIKFFQVLKIKKSMFLILDQINKALRVISHTLKRCVG